MSENLDFKKFQNFEYLNPLVRRFEGTLRFFMIFSIYDFFRNFQINLEVKKFQNFEDVNPVVGNCEGTLRGLRSLPVNMVAQISVVFEIDIS